jgi:hypothetical protein
MASKRETVLAAVKAFVVSSLPGAEVKRNLAKAERIPPCGLVVILPRHRTLDALHDGGGRAAIVFEPLVVILNGVPHPLADVLVIGALAGILKAPPAADVADEDCLEVCPARSASSSTPGSGSNSGSRQSSEAACLPNGPGDSHGLAKIQAVIFGFKTMRIDARRVALTWSARPNCSTAGGVRDASENGEGCTI